MFIVIVMQTTELFIFRHGETDWNVQRRFQGHTDVPLNAAGIRQAQELANVIRSCDLQAIVTSDLQRARRTAEIANEQLQLPLIVTTELRECGLGDSEGIHRDKLIEMYGEDSWQKWQSIRPEDEDFCYPNGETKRAHLGRLKRFLEGYCRTNKDHRRVGVSTHGGSLRRLIHACKGAPEAPVPIPNCVVYKIHYDHGPSLWTFKTRYELNP